MGWLGLRSSGPSTCYYTLDGCRNLFTSLCSVNASAGACCDETSLKDAEHNRPSGVRAFAPPPAPDTRPPGPLTLPGHLPPVTYEICAWVGSTHGRVGLGWSALHVYILLCYDPLTYDLDFQSPVRYSNDPYTCKKSSSTVNWFKKAYRRKDGHDQSHYLNPANAVGRNVVTVLLFCI